VFLKQKPKAKDPISVFWPPPTKRGKLITPTTEKSRLPVRGKKGPSPVKMPRRNKTSPQKRKEPESELDSEKSEQSEEEDDEATKELSATINNSSSSTVRPHLYLHQHLQLIVLLDLNMFQALL
jgi:hypothetical protein